MQQIGNRAGEAGTWHQLATIDLREGNYAAARANFQKSLSIRQQIGDRAGEAAIWHQLATIDLREGNCPAARENFQKSLEIEQQIGDRPGEAATFYQLGFLAGKMGRSGEGLRLVALCCLIDKSIGHGDTESDFKALSGMASGLGYGEYKLEKVIAEAAEAYKTDRGRSLLDAAFPPGE